MVTAGVGGVANRNLKDWSCSEASREEETGTWDLVSLVVLSGSRWAWGSLARVTWHSASCTKASLNSEYVVPELLRTDGTMAQVRAYVVDSITSMAAVSIPEHIRQEFSISIPWPTSRFSGETEILLVFFAFLEPP